MIKPHFLCVTPYEGMREIFRNIAAIRSDFTCTILLGDYELGVKIAKENFTENTDAIISRGETAQLLSDTFSVPIFKIKFSSYDILRALKAAQSISPRFVLVGRPSITKIGQTLCDLLQYTEVKIESISSVEDTENILRKARQDGYSLVVGDMRTVNYAQLMNMQSILIMSGIETIEDTLNNAMQAITCMNTYGIQKAVCPIISVVIPKGSPKSEKNAKNTIPKMISGVIIGSVAIYSMIPFPLKEVFVVPIAPRVPITAAAKAIVPPGPKALKKELDVPFKEPLNFVIEAFAPSI